MRGISGWNFNLEDLKAQAALVRALYLFFLLFITLFKFNKMHFYIFDKIDSFILYIFYFRWIVQRKDLIQNPHIMDFAKPRAISILDLAFRKWRTLLAPLHLERYFVFILLVHLCYIDIELSLNLIFSPQDVQDWDGQFVSAFQGQNLQALKYVLKQIQTKKGGLCSFLCK